MSLEEYLNHDEPHRFMIDEQVPWQDIISKKSKARRKAGSKRAKKKVRRNRKSDKKRDACYYKVRSRYEKWPSAYASGALVQCRKVGAANWGESTKKSWQEVLKEYDEQPYDKLSEQFKNLENELINAVDDYEHALYKIKELANKLQMEMDIPELNDDIYMATNALIEERSKDPEEYFSHIREIEMVLKERENKLLEK